MIDELRSMAIFASVVETGSFSAAGRRLQLGTSVVSYHVTELEKKLGVTLLYRSTRSHSLTQEGKRVLEASQRMLKAASEGLDSVADISDEPAGALCITVPAFMLRGPYETAVWNFAATNPKVSIELRESDAVVDLIAEGVDLAIRLGRLKDSTLKARKLGEFERVLVASPDYLAKFPKIKTPKDLAQCELISISILSSKIMLAKGKKKASTSFEQSRIKVDSIGGVKAALLAGLGVQRMPLSEVEYDLEAGSLVEVLPQWKLENLGVYAVWPESGPRSALTRKLIEHIIEQNTAP